MSPIRDSETKDRSQDEHPELSAQHTGDGAYTTSPAANKYFIVKSLTLQDLELSIRNGIWATQSHNEDILNKAYQVNYYHIRTSAEHN